MRGRGALSGSGMFLIELLMAILIFAVASAICLRIFVTSHFIAIESSSLSRAVTVAQNGAECFKAAEGALYETAELLRGGAPDVNGGALRLLYNGYLLEIKRVSRQGGLIEGEVNVSDLEGYLIFSVPVSVYSESEAAL